MPSLLPSLAVPLPQVSVAFGAVTGTYTPIGSFTSGVEIMTVVSTMNAAIQVSFDGVHDHFITPIGNTTPAALQFNFKSNLMVMGPVTIFVKTSGAGPGSGSLVVSGMSAILQ